MVLIKLLYWFNYLLKPSFLTWPVPAYGTGLTILSDAMLTVYCFSNSDKKSTR